MRLGEVLVAMNVLDGGHLETALAVQERFGCRLGQALTALKLVREETLVRALAQRLKVPSVQLEGRTLPPYLLRTLPAAVMLRRQVIPVAMRSWTRPGPLLVATSEPQDLRLLEELRFAAGMEVIPVLAGEREIAAALRRHGIAGNAAPIELPEDDGDFVIERGGPCQTRR